MQKVQSLWKVLQYTSTPPECATEVLHYLNLKLNFVIILYYKYRRTTLRNVQYD